MNKLYPKLTAWLKQQSWKRWALIGGGVTIGVASIVLNLVYIPRYYKTTASAASSVVMLYWRDKFESSDGNYFDNWHLITDPIKETKTITLLDVLEQVNAQRKDGQELPFTLKKSPTIGTWVEKLGAHELSGSEYWAVTSPTYLGCGNDHWTPDGVARLVINNNQTFVFDVSKNS